MKIFTAAPFCELFKGAVKKLQDEMKIRIEMFLNDGIINNQHFKTHVNLEN
jgi:hypothetical protein